MGEANISIKQRLVGAIVLVSLGVIFLPMLLDGDDKFDVVKRAEFIPKEPEIKRQLNIAGNLRSPEAEPAENRSAVTIVDTVSEKIVSEKIVSEKIASEKTVSGKIAASKTRSEKAPPKKHEVATTATPEQKTPAEQAEKTTAASLAIDKQLAAVEKLKNNSKNTVKAFAVQLGSFKTRPNALKLRNQLREKGFPSYVEAVTTRDGQSYRVRVGPESLLTSAESLKKKLSKVVKMDGIIVSH